MQKVGFFGLQFMCCGTLDAAEYIVNSVDAYGVTSLVMTPNVNLIVMMQKEKEILEVFRSASMIVADGMPLVWLARILRLGIKERVCGSDLLPEVSRLAALQNKSIAIVGGAPGVAAAAAEKLVAMYPELHVCGTYSPPMGFDKDEQMSADVVEICKSWKPSILFLCLGSPKQELWAYRNIANLSGVGSILCVGAAADFMAGKVKRAPLLLRRAGLEWFWRVCQEPRRLAGRYLSDAPLFLFYACKEFVLQIRKKIGW